MSTIEEGGPGSVPEGHECEEGMMWSEEDQKCVPVATVEPDLGESEGTSSLMESIIKTIKEMNEKMYNKLRSEQKADLEKIRKELAGEAERTLRKTFGLEVDPVLHHSDFPKLAREYMLKTASGTRRVPASPGATGPDGNRKELGKPEHSRKIESLFKEFGVKN